MADIKRNKVSDDVLRQMICELLDTGERGATNFYELLRTKIQLEKSRCLKMYPVVESEWVKFKDKVVSEQRASDIANAASEGLKSDLEIELHLCNLAFGNLEVEETTYSEQFGVTTFKRKPTPGEMVSAVKEIWKKRGSYAPIKQAQTNKDGEDVPMQIIFQPAPNCNAITDDSNNPITE